MPFSLYHMFLLYRTDSRSLLSGVLYCGHCGSRLCFNHQHSLRERADGSKVDYEYKVHIKFRISLEQYLGKTSA